MKSRAVVFVCCLGTCLVCTCSREFNQPFDYGVWAIRITRDDQLIRGRTAKGKVGDYKIWNDRVAFIIQDVGLSSGYKRFGGVPIDADVIRDPELEPGASQLGELFFGFNQRLFEPTAAEIQPARKNNPRAMIRLSGRDAYFPWLGAFLGSIFPMDPINCDLIFEYSLGPQDEALRIDITIRSRNAKTLWLDMVEVALIAGDGLNTYFEGPGFNQDEHSGDFPYWVGQGDRVSYGLLAEEGELSLYLNFSNVSFGTYPQLELTPRGEASLTRYLAVAAGGVSEIQRIFRTITGNTAAGVLSGRVVADPQALQNGIRVHVLTADGKHASVSIPDPDGTFTAELVPGSFELLAKSDGFDPSALVPVEILENQQSTVELILPPSTHFDYQVTEDGSRPIPARLTFLRQDSAPTNILRRLFGEEQHSSGAALVIHSATGEGSGVLPYGSYQVVATRGNEYQMDQQTLLANGEPAALSFTLPRVTDSQGYLSGDFHIHGEFSPDTSVAKQHRVRTALSENLELLVMTEHDSIHNYGPVVASLPGADEWVKAITGSEITTYQYGHFNAFPLTEKPDQINHGGIEWFDTRAPDLFDRIRASESRQVTIQLNHPRSASPGGYFSAMGLNTALGTIQDMDNWSEDFDSVEVFNGGCGNGNGQELFDWFDLLNRGYRVSISGGSDSHSELSELGMPRVYLRTDRSPKDFAPEELVANFRNQQVFVSCGPFLRFSIDGKGLGELVPVNGPLSAHARVEAPSWMTLEELRIIRNGKVAWSLPASAWTGGSGAVRFDDTIVLDAAEDGWYVLEVKGSGNQFPFSGDTPYAITNPIYVDFDRNGVFDPPLPDYRAAGGA